MGNKNLFSPTDILLPTAGFERWSVVACDQFSSQPDYWERVSEYVGAAPSTLHMIIPEAFLGKGSEREKAGKIRAAMEKYLTDGTLSNVEDSFIYIEREQSDGRVRKGLVGAIDLEDYEFSEKKAPIRASEGTILERLPARVEVRKTAPIELPHIIAFISDKENTVIEPLAGRGIEAETLYDFPLMQGGGHIKGKRVAGEMAQKVINAFDKLSGAGGILMIIGDGNHSLAGAKVYWDEIKQGLSGKERETHPARKALIEVCNVYDPAIDFEAIHRVLFGVDADGFIKVFEAHIQASNEAAAQNSNEYPLKCVKSGGSAEVRVKAACIGDMLELVQEFLDRYLKENKDGHIDYIHGEATTEELGRGERCVGLILPAMDKTEFFDTVAIRGVFPRKSFSVGHAEDKRYYLECRKIR